MSRSKRLRSDPRSKLYGERRPGPSDTANQARRCDPNRILASEDLPAVNPGPIVRRYGPNRIPSAKVWPQTYGLEGVAPNVPQTYQPYPR